MEPLRVRREVKNRRDAVTRAHVVRPSSRVVRDADNEAAKLLAGIACTIGAAVLFGAFLCWLVLP